MASTWTTHYALVNSGCLPLTVEEDQSSADSPANVPSRLNSNPRSELSELYQFYAELYPNPRLIEEFRLRETLLQAASAANHAHSMTLTNKPKRGWFASFFGSSGSEETTTVPNDKVNSGGSNATESPLVYTNIPCADEAEELCGTHQSIELSCIPQEAYSVARFHLASTATRRDNPNSIRWGPMAMGKPVPPISLVVVGLGEIAEFHSKKKSTTSNISHTSDREELRQYCQRAQEENPYFEGFQLEYVRACAISPNCLAVSWGFGDGLVVIYRKIRYPDFEGWEQMWIIGPSRPVVEAMGDDAYRSQQEGQDSYPDSPLLRVSDVLPLRVETADGPQPMVATLAIARLGGFLELLPLPTRLWFGAELSPDNYPQKFQAPKKQRGRQPLQHYAFGKDVGGPTVALTTSDHHADVITLEAFRTSVKEESEWDSQAYPNSPPSEFILAASGMSEQEGQECISFWTVSTLFPDEQEPQTNDPVGFHLHAEILERVQVPTGASISTFATPEIMEHWRTPRHVELRSDAETSDGSVAPQEEVAHPVTSISTTAPIVSIQFSNATTGGGTDRRPVLAALDWNGCASILDCSFAERVASQQLSSEEYQQLAATDSSQRTLQLVGTLVSRNHFGKVIGHKGHVANLQWLGGEVNDDTLPPLVLLLKKSAQSELCVVTFNVHEALQRPAASTLALPFPSPGATMGDLGSGDISFVAQVVGSTRTKLKYFAMKQLEPVAIVETLARESKFEEAIEAASKLDDLDQATISEVIEECHQRLWETKRNIDSLADTRNIAYIVDEALATCRSKDETEDITFDKLRLLCELAITMGRNYSPARSQLEELRGFLVKLGTYQLLCKYMSVEPSLKKLRAEVQDTPIEKIAESVARRGDVLALSIVCFRHRKELVAMILDLLGNIPLSVHPESFAHLVPHLKNGTLTDSFLSSTTEDEGLLHWSSMPQHLAEKEGIAIAVDPKDEKLVLEFNSSISTDSCGHLYSSIPNWFVERAGQMQNFIGNVQTVILLGELGLKCAGAWTDIGEMSLSPVPIQRLHRTWRSATALQKMLVDDVVSLDGDESKESTLPRILHTDDLMSMTLEDLVHLVLQGETDHAKVFSRCAEYLQPLLMDMDEAGADDLDAALIAYCTNMAVKCQSLATSACSEVQGQAARTVATCTALASCSKASVSVNARLIKNTRKMTEMVLSVISMVLGALGSANAGSGVYRSLQESLWVTYECLPAHIPSTASSTDIWLPLLEKVESLFQDLVGMDIVSRWPGCDPFEFFAARRGNVASEVDSSKSSGTEALARMCYSLCSFIGDVSSHDARSSLLQDLLSDTEQLDEQCYDMSLPLPAVLCTHLVRPLLRLEQFRLIKVYLSSKPFLLERGQVKQTILAYVDEAVFSEDGSSAKTQSAIKCQDVVGPSFPEIQADFLSIRRYLDASHFISSVIYEGQQQSPMKPSQLRQRLPLDVVESVLQDHPASVVCGIPQWQDRVFARDANRILRASLDSTRAPDESSPDPVQLPELPGGAIFHLATILELEDDNSALVVQCRVIHYAMLAGLHGAAAAICRTLVRTQSDVVDDEAVAVVKLDAVAKVVSEIEYSDVSTKLELCQAALGRFRGSVSVGGSAAFDVILRQSTLLSHQSSRFSNEQLDIRADRHSLLMSRPVSRLPRQLLAEYNTDVHGLFAYLLSQASEGLVHDSLLDDLSRFIFYWCISDSKALKKQLRMSDKMDAVDNLALGSALVLHIPSIETATRRIQELHGIAADQAATVSSEERFSSDDDLCVPDPQLVAFLQGRGYSENAARRTAVLTRNAATDKALVWAVTHTQDSDFNDPILVLRNPNRGYVDEDAMQGLQRVLFFTQHLLEEPTAIAALLKTLSTMGHTGEELEETTDRQDSEKENPMEPTPLTPATSSAEANSNDLGLPDGLEVRKQPIEDRAPKQVRIHESEGLNPPVGRPIDLTTPAQQPRATPQGGHERIPQGSANTKGLTGATRDAQTTTPVAAVLPADTAPPGEQKKGALRSAGKPKPSPPPRIHQRPRPPSKARMPRPPVMHQSQELTAAANLGSPLSAHDRSALLKQGQKTLTKLRSSGVQADRKRLIESGRRLLNQARAKASPPVKIPPPPPPKAASAEPAKQAREVNAPAKKIPFSPPSSSGEDGSGWDFDEFNEW